MDPSSVLVPCCYDCICSTWTNVGAWVSGSFLWMNQAMLFFFSTNNIFQRCRLPHRSLSNASVFLEQSACAFWHTWICPCCWHPCLKRTLMDEWHFSLLVNCVLQWIIKINTAHMIAFQRGGSRVGSNQSKVFRAPNYAPEESSCISSASVSMVVRIAWDTQKQFKCI